MQQQPFCARCNQPIFNEFKCQDCGLVFCTEVCVHAHSKTHFFDDFWRWLGIGFLIFVGFVILYGLGLASHIWFD